MNQELHLPTQAINTRTAWRPILRPISAIVIAAQLALVLQPLSALAQEKGQQSTSPMAQSQLNRINLLNRDTEAAKAQKQIDAASPADQASAQLERISSLVHTLAADDSAQKRTQAKPATNPTNQATTPASPTENSKDLRAIGPGIRIEVERSPSQTSAGNTDKAFQLSSAQRQAQLKELQSLLTDQNKAQAAIRAEFAATRQELEAKKLPSEIIARHDQAAAQYEQRATEFNQIAVKLTSNQPLPDTNTAQAAIQTIASQTTANQATSIEQLNDFLQRHQSAKRTAPALDPSKGKAQLPWRSPEPTQRAPAETQTAWHQQLYGHEQVKLAQAGGPVNIGGLSFTTPPEPASAPTAADLTETAETQLTAAIRAKAAELGHNPVQIHNWLLTSITWQPTWGAMQSADSVLSSQRGNAIDIASLHIALLRASSIPARYQFGTIELPAAQAQNWTGNLQTPQAAQQIMGQGGIATRGITEGGRFTKLRIEHVWVNAYVNWAPSRGARQGGAVISSPGGGTTNAPHGAAQHPSPNPALNAWVPMDASFKQYSYQSGMNLQQSVPLDATALLAAAQQGATVNAQEGWVQNLNQANLQTELNNYQARLQAHINSTPTGASSTVGDVIGRQSIPSANYQQLAGSLPYATVQTGSQATSIPASLQHRFTYQVSDQYGQELLTYNERVAHINGKRLTLSYIPATQADADTIASYLPRPNADGSPIRPEQLPTSLPGYLIRLKPQINLDGQAVATATQAVQMGSDLPSSGGFTSLANIASWDITTDGSNIAGQATAIGISAGGISAAQLNNLKTRLQNTQTQLQAAQANPSTATATLAGITGEQISGDLLTATIWSWFAAAESHNRLSQTQAGMVEVPALSYGLFHAVAQPIYSWGIVRAVKFPGVNLDIGHVRNISWASDNDSNKWIAYNKLRGQYMSALEHAIPERFFNDPAKCNAEGGTTQTAGLPVCPQGISAVKALALAAAQGQKIYTITRQVYENNPSIISQKLSQHSIDTRQRVQQALDAGYEVSIHEAPITQSGWTGAGYTTIDPNTGAGGYLIDGGSNGGYKEKLESDVGIKLLNFFGVNEQPKTFHAPALAATVAVTTLAIYSAVNTVQELWNCYKQQIGEAVLTILLFIAAAFIIAALVGGTGGLAAGLAAALGALTVTATNAAPSGRPTCEPPKMRVQFQVSPRSSGSQTFETFSRPILGEVAVGVTTRQVRDTMSDMFNERPAWIPAGVDLRGLIIQMSQCISRYPPFGTDPASNPQICSPQQSQFGGLWYRVDLENISGTNLKE